jgi:hypothetical protein
MLEDKRFGLVLEGLKEKTLLNSEKVIRLSLSISSLLKIAAASELRISTPFFKRKF